MAQIFPLNIDDLSPDGERVSLAGTLAALHDPWTLLRHRRIGAEEAEPVEVVLVHPEIGVALVDQAPRDPALSARRLREHLDQQRFGEFFPGDLPIVALSVAADEFEAIGERLAAAFEAAPRLSVTDADWADAVIELLMVPDDLAMAPVGETVPAPTPEPELPPARRERFEESPRDLYQRSPALDGSEPPLPLMVDWPFAASYERKRRRGWVAALVIILLLLAGAGFAAWEYAGEDKTVATNDAPPPSQIEIPLPPQSRGDRAAGQPAASSPPPVPAAPPVVMAQKPYAPPPPAPPAPTPVEPLPQVTAAAPPSPPPAPQRPTPFAAPAGSSEPPGGALGPPVPLWRAQASNAAPSPAAAEPSTRECRPYTSSTTLTGRGLRVEGIACRGSDGQWRLVSEVPLR